MWSTDVTEHLLKANNNENLAVRFSFECIDGYGQQNSWKAEFLQIIKLFNEDLASKDPFYI